MNKWRLLLLSILSLLQSASTESNFVDGSYRYRSERLSVRALHRDYVTLTTQRGLDVRYPLPDRRLATPSPLHQFKHQELRWVPSSVTNRDQTQDHRLLSRQQKSYDDVFRLTSHRNRVLGSPIDNEYFGAEQGLPKERNSGKYNRDVSQNRFARREMTKNLRTDKRANSQLNDVRQKRSIDTRLNAVKIESNRGFERRIRTLNNLINMNNVFTTSRDTSNEGLNNILRREINRYDSRQRKTSNNFCTALNRNSRTTNLYEVRETSKRNIFQSTPCSIVDDTRSKTAQRLKQRQTKEIDSLAANSHSRINEQRLTHRFTRNNEERRLSNRHHLMELRVVREDSRNEYFSNRQFRSRRISDENRITKNHQDRSRRSFKRSTRNTDDISQDRSQDLSTSTIRGSEFRRTRSTKDKRYMGEHASPTTQHRRTSIDNVKSSTESVEVIRQSRTQRHATVRNDIERIHNRDEINLNIQRAMDRVRTNSVPELRYVRQSNDVVAYARNTYRAKETRENARHERVKNMRHTSCLYEESLNCMDTDRIREYSSRIATRQNARNEIRLTRDYIVTIQRRGLTTENLRNSIGLITAVQRFSIANSNINKRVAPAVTDNSKAIFRNIGKSVRNGIERVRNIRADRNQINRYAVSLPTEIQNRMTKSDINLRSTENSVVIRQDQLRSLQSRQGMWNKIESARNTREIHRNHQLYATIRRYVSSKPEDNLRNTENKVDTHQDRSQDLCSRHKTTDENSRITSSRREKLTREKRHTIGRNLNSQRFRSTEMARDAQRINIFIEERLENNVLNHKARNERSNTRNVASSLSLSNEKQYSIVYQKRTNRDDRSEIDLRNNRYAREISLRTRRITSLHRVRQIIRKDHIDNKFINKKQNQYRRVTEERKVRFTINNQIERSLVSTSDNDRALGTPKQYDIVLVNENRGMPNDRERKQRERTNPTERTRQLRTQKRITNTPRENIISRVEHRATNAMKAISNIETNIFVMKWQYMFYLMQGIYICGLFMKMTKENGDVKKTRFIHWFTMDHLKVN